MDKPYPALIQRLIYYSKLPSHLNHLQYVSNAHLSRINRQMELIAMATMSSKNVRKPNTNSWPETIFVSLKIAGQHKDGFNEWMQRKEAEIALDVAAFISNGHKVSISWDVQNACFIVAATCKEDSNVNLNHCMTSRSSEWWEALCMNVYKNNVVCNMGSWATEQDTTNWG